MLKLVHASLVALVFIVSGCATDKPNVAEVNDDPLEATGHKTAKTSTTANKKNVGIDTVSTQANTSSKLTKRAAEFYPGTGTFTARPSSGLSSSTTEGDITLMFQDAPIEEVAMTILGDLLGRAYVVDERVKGSVSLKTGRPLARDSLIPVMKTF